VTTTSATYLQEVEHSHHLLHGAPVSVHVEACCVTQGCALERSTLNLGVLLWA
jgi:hypothetical protein